MADQAFDPAQANTSASAKGPAFVSRSRLESQVDAPILASDGSLLPTLRTPYVRWILFLAVTLQIYAWWRVDGYQLADSVEFMERARALVRGEQLVDAGVVRPIGFSFLLIPVFGLGEWIGVRDERALVWCVVLLQMALGLVLAWRCMRIGARVAARTGAIAAGFIVVTNPVFLQWSTQPISDLAAGVCFAFALELVLERGSFRRSLVAGLWLGVGFTVAYKTLLFTLLLIAFSMVRDRFKRTAAWRGLVPGVSIAILVQCTLDWVMYRSFGASIANYFAANFVQIITIVMYRISVLFHWEWLYKRGEELYYYKEKLLGIEDYEGRGEMSLASKQPLYFYVTALPTFFVWPLIAVGVAALVRLFKRREAKLVMLACVSAGAFAVMSLKGSKDFRLALPLLPLLAPWLASGWEWIASDLLRGRAQTRALLAAGGSVAVIVLSISALMQFNVKHFGGYWSASDWVDAFARSTYRERLARTVWPGKDGEPEPLRVGYAYHWAVYLRHSPLVQVAKLPWQLNLWKQYEKKVDHGSLEKAEDFAAIEDLDLFVVHLPILSSNPDLMSFVNARFEVLAALYDQRTYDDIGPIFVLARRTGSKDARTFFDVTRGVGEEEFTRARQVEPPLDFVDIENQDRVRLLGVEYTTLPPQEFGWITYHWRVPRPVQRDWWILDRMTSPNETNVWENNHAPAYGTRPTSHWTPDEIVSESYLVVPAHRAYESFGRVRPIGNAYRRGDLIPTRTWMKLVALDPTTLKGPGSPTIVAEMMPARLGAAGPVRTPAEVGLQEMPDGIQFAADDFVRVASFFIPVLAPWRLPDDGRPVED